MGMNNYHVLECCGEGSFGKVYKGRRKYSGQIVALKFIPKVGKSEKELRSLRREIDIMRGLHHENIIEMLDSFDTDKEVVVVTDYAEGELFQILEDDGNLPEEQVQTIAAQLISALFYLHSHRILHRDMKPQNILLGTGGIVKLCDFGFARGMSTNTLVLTSIKGTPLYMSPELVEEKPYDHTADLWAVGCILYELFVGTPPFYTNSIFQLVSMIIKDPVKWPKNMSLVFKDFLQGLLNKNPRQRLSWPELLHHPFVATLVKVSEEDTQLQSPFTQPLTASMIILKEQQSKDKAHPPGTSKILARARRKAVEDDEKKKPQGHKVGVTSETRPQAWEGDQLDAGVYKGVGAGEEVIQAAWETTGISKNVDPTPRPDRLTKDYEKEYPSIEVEGRRTIKKKSDGKKNIENVKLDGEDIDSEDEWQSLIEATDQEGDPEVALHMLTDASLVEKLKSRLQTSSAEVLVGTLEGAARLRNVLNVVANMVTLKSEVENIVKFCTAIGIPGKILKVLSDIINTTSAAKEQPWAQQILIDLVITLNAYFASEISWAKNIDKIVTSEYIGAIQTLMKLAPVLMMQQIDVDMRLREQSLLCMIYACEAVDRLPLEASDAFFSDVAASHRTFIDTLVFLVQPEPDRIDKLAALPECTREMALDRQESLINLVASCLAAFLHTPLKGDFAMHGKRQIAEYLAQILCKADQLASREFLRRVLLPTDCSTMLKIIYACCQASHTFCGYICGTDLEALLEILMGKVEVVDMEVNTVVETVLYILCTLVIQLQLLPDRLSDASSLLISVFLDSTLASHTAAAALLFGQMVASGMSCEVQPEEMLQACLAVFTDLAEVCVRCPFNYGILDGLLLLLRELVPQVDMPVAQLYIETGIWGSMWHRVAQALQVTSPTSHLPIHDIEVEGQHDLTRAGQKFIPPDWELMSPQGLMAVLQIAVSVFTKETYQCLPNLATSDSIVMLTLVHLLHPAFLENIGERYKEEGKQLREDILLAVTQLACFPFAVDINDDLLGEIQMCLFNSELLPRLLAASARYLRGEMLETPAGLMARLVLGNNIFVQQFSNAVRDVQCSDFLCSCLSTDSSLSVVCDVVSIISHLVRTSPEHLNLVVPVLKGTNGDFSLLSSMMSHSSSMVKSRTCSLLGNLMKHDSQIYPVLLQREKILHGLVACLRDEDSNVRKGAAYAIGNASYHSGQLYPRLKVAIPALVQLLRDPQAKTRANVTSACGNLGMHSAVLCPDLKKSKVIAHLLEVALHDSQSSVQVSALLALRSLCQQEELCKDLILLKAVDRLGHLTATQTPRPGSAPRLETPRPETPLSRPGSSMAPNAQVPRCVLVTHCNKLIRLLQAKT